jgi:hypothetical protein
VTSALRMAGFALFALMASRAAAANDAGNDTAKALSACHGLMDEKERLKCYDAIALQVSPPTFSGRLTATTERFTIMAPHVLRYESDGPIFVMYLKNDAGEVVQNLHIGGGGQERYVIEQPGTYFLTVSGSETWRIWLAPQ